MAVAVFFGAHADDVELGAGGTCAKLCAAAFDVRIVVATDESDQTVAATRRKEAIAAAAILGVPADRVHFLGLPDGQFRCGRDTVARIRALSAAWGLYADAVFTHTEAESHQDHIELTRIVKAAFRKVAIFKYRVRNSAIDSHFQPNISSNIGGYVNLRSAALCQHKTQIALQRVGKLGCEDSEAFELEIQEGAANYFAILDRVNDAPFSRFWMPLCASGKITVVAQPAQPPRSYAPVFQCVPSDLHLVTRLQEQLFRVMHTQLNVQPLHVATEDALPVGASIILGGPYANPTAQVFCDQLPSPRFRFDLASNEYLIDTHTGTVFEPMFRSIDGTSFELIRDYGLLTISHISGAKHGREESLVIAAMGVHAPGTAAVFSCLLSPEYIAPIIADARRVIEGAAETAQWVVPCDGCGTPLISEITSHVDASTYSQPRTLRHALDSRICASN
jgi:LmbE family N-acetylglucosaminyl deacetylase